MSHIPERKEKDCLNCGAAVQGRFCHICGQENIEPKESFWHLVTHFMYDITHFDGKFFSTLRYLLFKPGFLSHEYLRGRRATYLHPIRMYVFTSAIFFLIFFSLKKENELVKVNETKPTAAALLKKLEKRKAALVKSLNDSLPEIARKPILFAIAQADSNIAAFKADTTKKEKFDGDSNGFNFYSTNTSKKYATLEEYDSAQAKLTSADRDNFLERKLIRQNIHLREKYQGDSKATWEAIWEKFKHLFPQMLFVSLPLFAGMLKLLYIRRKQFFYVNHVVFTIHLYCGTFIIILAGILLSELLAALHIGKDWVGGVFTLAGMFYWYKSLRGFYEQRRAKTVMKYMLIFFLSGFIMVFLFLFFFIFSAMAI